MKKKIGAVVIILILLAVVLLAGKMMFPSMFGKEEEIEYSYDEFVLVEDVHTEKTEEGYFVKAQMTIPDISKYILEFGESDVFKKDADWEDMEGKIAGEFYRFLKKQKTLETKTYEIDMDLSEQVNEYMMSIEYLEKQENVSATVFEFSEEQIQDILIKEAFRINMNAFTAE